MMDFKLILLLAGLGLGLLVLVFSLLGFLAGFKKELRCTAVAFVLVLLAILVFGDPSTILNLDGGFLKGTLTGVSDSAKTVWDVILSLVQGMVPNGADIFVDGSESYAFLYALVAGVVRGISLIVGTFAMLIVILLANSIYRIVSRIITSKRAKKAKLEPVANVEEAVDASDASVVLSSDGESKDGVVVTTKANPYKRAKLDRLWGALLATARAVVIIIILFTPISGICTVLDEVTPETETLIKKVLNGEATLSTSSQTDDYVDMAIDFRDAYHESAIGKIVESSSFFFKDSFSTHLFDGAFKITTDTSSFALRDEVVVIMNAVNALEGNTQFAELSDKEVNGALNALKDSKLIVAAMPAAIEVAYNFDVNGKKVADYLTVAGTNDDFLSLRNENWKKDFGHILDAVKEAYKLGFLKSDFNYLTMKPEILRSAINELTKANALNKVLNIAIPTAIKLDAVKDIVGDLNLTVDMSNFNWNKEFNTFVDMYDIFQDLGITTLSGIDTNALVEEILNDENKFNIVSNLVSKVFSLQLIDVIGLDIACNYVEALPTVKEYAGQYIDEIKEIIRLLPSDIDTYLEAVKEALPLLDFSEGLTPKVDVLNLDTEVLRDTVDKLFETETFERILPLATHVAFGLTPVKELIGNYDINIDPDNVNWKQDFTTIIDIYDEFKKLELTDLAILQNTDQLLEFVKGAVENETKNAALTSIFDKLATLEVFQKVGVPASNAILNTVLAKNGFTEYVDIIDLNELSADDWKQDFNTIASIIKSVDVICDYKLSLENVRFDEEGMNEAAEVIGKVLSLNILGDDDTKNALIIASLNHFNLLNEEDIQQLDLSNVVWNDEIVVLQEIIRSVPNITKYSSVDINNLKFDVNAILTNQELIDDAVDMLEKIVDSNLVLELVPGLINKYALPLVDNYDQEGELAEIIKGYDSKLLIEEILKFAEALKAAVKLGVFDINTLGLEAINYEETESMHTIVNTIFDSKLIEGNEGKIIRILLKITKVLEDVEKGALEGIDYDREQQLLNDAISALEVVLQDEDFVLFVDGRINLDLSYITKSSTLNAALDALNCLFGKYTPESETSGSAIIERLIKPIYEKYIKTSLPTVAQEITELVELTDATNEQIVGDIRRVVYSAGQLVDVNVQTLVNGNDYDFSEAGDAICNVLDAIFDTYSIKNHEDKLVAYGLSLAFKTAGINASVTEEDFANIDWLQEVEILKDVVNQVIALANDNELVTVNSIKEVVSSTTLLNSYITKENAGKVIDILGTVVTLNTIDNVLPALLTYGLSVADSKGFDLKFLDDELTPTMLYEDIVSILEIAEIAVNEAGIVELYHSNFEGLIPGSVAINKILDILFDLNLVNGKEADLINFALNKFLNNDAIAKFIKPSDFVLDETFDFDSNLVVIKDIITSALELVEFNNITTIKQVTDFINNKEYMSETYLMKANFDKIADMLALTKDSSLVRMAIAGVIRNVSSLEALEKFGDFSCLQQVQEADLVHDIELLSNIVKEAVLLKPQDYILYNDFKKIDYEVVANVIAMIGQLDLVNNYASEIVASVLPYVFNTTLKLNLDNLPDALDIDWANEFETLGNVVLEAKPFLENNKLVNIKSITEFAKNISTTYKDYLTEENAEIALCVVDELFNMQLVKSLALNLVDYAIEFAANKGFDIAFVKEELTDVQIVEDLHSVISIARIAIVDGDAIELYKDNFTGKYPTYEVVEAILDKVFALNLIDGKEYALINLLVSKLVKGEQVEKFIKASDVTLDASYDFESDYNVIKNALHRVFVILENNNLDTINSVKQFITNKDFLNSTYLTESNLDSVAKIIPVLADATLVRTIAAAVIHNVGNLEQVKNIGEFAFLQEIEESELRGDIKLIGWLIDDASYEITSYLLEKDIKNINYNRLGDIVTRIGEFDILNNYVPVALPEIVEYVLNKVKFNVPNQPIQSDYNVVSMRNEFNILGKVVKEVGKSLNVNNLNSLGKVLTFVKGINKNDIYTMGNEQTVAPLFKALDFLTDSDLLTVLSYPLFVSAIDLACDYGYYIPYLADNMNNELLMEDVKSILDTLEKVVFDAKALEIYVNDFYGDIPQEEVVVDILDSLFGLNMLNGNVEKLLDSMVAKFMPENKFVKATDFDFLHGYSFASDYEYIKNVIHIAYDFLAYNNLHSITELILFINQKDFMNKEVVSDYYLDAAHDLLVELNEIQVVRQALTAVVRNLVNDGFFDKFGNFSVLASYGDDELLDDLKVLANVVVLAKEAGAVEFYKTNDIDPINFEAIASAVNELGNLNFINVYAKALIPEIVNYVSTSVLKLATPISVTSEDLTGIYWSLEFNELADVIKAAGTLLDNNNLISVGRIARFFKNKDYMLYHLLVTEVNANLVVDLFNEVLDSSLAKIGIFVGAGVALDVAAQKGYDVKFLLEDMNASKLKQDLKDIALVLDNVVNEMKAIDIIVNNVEGNIPDYEDVEFVLTKLLNINLINGKEDRLISFVLDKFLPKNNYLSKYDFDLHDYDFDTDLNAILSIIASAYDFLDVQNIHEISDIKSFIANKKYLDKGLINNDNALIVANILDALESFELFEQAVAGVARNFQFFNLVDSEINFEFLKEVNRETFEGDFAVLANIVRKAVEANVLSIVTTNDLNPIKYVELSEMVTNIGELHVLSQLGSQIVVEGYNYLFNKVLGLNTTRLTYEDAAYFNAVDDFALLGQAIYNVGTILKSMNLKSISSVINFVKNRDYTMGELYINTDNANLLIDALTDINNTTLFRLALLNGVSYSLKLASSKGIDLEFLTEGVTRESIVNDFASIIDVLSIIVNDMHALDIYQAKYVGDVPAASLFNEVINSLFTLSLVDGKMDKVLSFALKYLPKNDFVKAEDFNFDSYNFENDLASINMLVNDLNQLLYDNNLLRVENIVKFFKDKQYTDYVLIKEENAIGLSNIIEDFANNDLVAMALTSVLHNIPNLTQIKNIGDFSSLVAVNKDDVKHDLGVLSQIALDTISIDAYVYAITGDVNSFKFEELATMVNRLGELIILNKTANFLVPELLNFATDKLGIQNDIEFTPLDFDSLVWSNEVSIFADVVRLVGEEFYALNLNNVSDVMNFIKNKYYLDYAVVSERTHITNVINVFDRLLDSMIVNESAHIALGYGLSFAKNANLDLVFLCDNVESDKVIEDIRTLFDLVLAIFDANAVGYAFNDEVLDQAKMNDVFVELSNTLNLNVLRGEQKRERLIANLLNKFGIEVELSELDGIDWPDETAKLVNVVSTLNDVLLALDLTKLKDITGIISDYSSYFVIDANMNHKVTKGIELVESIKQSALVSKLVFPLSRKFLANESLAGLADIHNIYDNPEQVMEDLDKLIDVVNMILALEPYHVATSHINLPYDKVQEIGDILRTLVTLNYLTNNGRLEAIVNALAKQDLDFDYSDIDLAYDAELLIEALDFLQVVLTDSNFYWKKLSDFNVKHNIDLKYWLSDEYLSPMTNALTNIVKTTVVSRTGGVIVFLIAIPILKKVANDFYEVLDLENTPIESLNEDYENIIHVIDSILAFGIEDIVNGKVFTTKFENFVLENASRLIELNIFAGRGEALLDCVLTRLDGKNVLNKTFNKDAYDLSNVDLKEDLYNVLDAYRVLCEYNRSNNIYDINKFVNRLQTLNVKEELKDDETINKVVLLLNEVLSLTLVKYNGLSAYNEYSSLIISKLPENYKELADLEGVYADDTMLHSDLVRLVNVLNLAKEFGLASIARGENINFDQATIVKAMLEQLSELIIVESKLEYIVDLVSSLLPQLELVDVKYAIDDFDISEDLIVLGNIYENLIPLLLSEEFPIKNIKSLSPQISSEKLQKLIYDYQSQIASAIVNSADISIAPEIIKVVYRALEKSIPAQYDEYLNTIYVIGIERELLRHDLRQLGIILENVYQMNVLDFVINKNNIGLYDKEKALELVSSILDLNVLADNYKELFSMVYKKNVGVNAEVEDDNFENLKQSILTVVSYAYDIINRNDIASVVSVQEFVQLPIKQMMVKLIDDADLNDLASIINELDSCPLFANNIKYFLRSLLPNIVGNALLKEIVAFDSVSNTEFIEDLEVLASILREVANSNLSEAYLDRTIAIDYESVAIPEIISLGMSLNMLEAYGDEIVEYVDSKVSFDLSRIKVSEMNLDEDSVVLVNIYNKLVNIFTSPNYEFKTVSDYTNGKLSTSMLKKLLIEQVSTIEEVIKEFANVSISPAILRTAIEILKTKAPSSLLPYVNALEVDSIEDELLRKDIVTLSKVLKNASDMGLIDFIVNSNNVVLDDSDVNELLTNVLSLNIIEANYESLLTAVSSNALHVTLDTTSLDYEADSQVIMNVATYAITLLENASTTYEYNSIAGISKLTKLPVLDLVKMFASDEQLTIIATMINELNSSALVNNNSLPLATKLLEKVKVSEVVKPITRLTRYDLEGFNSDLTSLAKLVKDLALTNLNEAIIDQDLVIDFDNEHIEKVIIDVLTTNLVKLYTDVLVNVLNEKASSIFDASLIDSSVIDLELDALSIVEAYYHLANVLESSAWEHNTVNKIQTLLANKKVSVGESILTYELLTELVNSLVSLNNTTISSELLKVILDVAKKAVNEEYKPLLDTSLTSAQYAEDYVLLTDLLYNALNGAYKEGFFDVYIIKDVNIEKSEYFINALNDAFALNILDGKLSDLVIALLKVAKVDTTSIDLSSVDWDNEKALLVSLVENAFVVLSSLDITTTNEVVEYAKTNISQVTTDLKEALELLKNKDVKQAVKTLLRTVMTEGKKVDVEALTNTIEKVFLSETIQNIFVEVYKQKVYSKLSGSITAIANIRDYTTAQYTHDSLLLANIVRNVYESNLYTIATTRTLPELSSVETYLDSIISDMVNLIILNIKKDDIPLVLETIASKLGKAISFDSLDKASINFASDEVLYQNGIKALYEATRLALVNGLDLSLLGNSTLVENLIVAFDNLSDTTLAVELGDVVFAIVNNKLSPRGIVINTDTSYVYDNMVSFAHDMLEMGVFSNGGIDFTNRDRNLEMLSYINNSVTLPDALSKIVNKVFDYADALGVVDFTYEGLSLKNELTTLIDSLTSAISFARSHASNIKARNFAFINETSVQNDINQLVLNASKSKIVEQLFFPMIEGVYRAATRSSGDGNMVYDENMTITDFVNTTLPNVYEMISLIDEICGFNFSNISLTKFAQIADLLETIASEELLKDNINELILVLFNKVIKVELTEEDKELVNNANMDIEIQYLVEVFDTLQEVYDEKPFEFNAEGFADAETLIGIGKALKVLASTYNDGVFGHPVYAYQSESQLISIFGKTLLGLAVNKLDKENTQDLANALKATIDSETYTRSDITLDFKKFVDLIPSLANSGIIKHKAEYSQYAYNYINGENQLVERLLSLKLVSGNELVLLDTLVALIPEVESYYNEASITTNEQARQEMISVFNALEQIKNYSLSDMDTLMNDVLAEDSSIDITVLLKSLVIKNAIVNVLNDMLPYYINKNVITVDEIDLFMEGKTDEVARDDWKVEFKAVKDLLDYVDGGTLRANTVYEIYADTVLIRKLLVESAETLLPGLPVIGSYYAGTTLVSDWVVELDNLMNVLNAFGSRNLDSNLFADPLNNVNGQLVLAICHSEVLKVELVQKINDTLPAEYQSLCNITVADLDLVTTAEGWDNEFEAVKTFIKVANNEEVEDKNAKVVNIYNNTTLVKALMNRSASKIIKSLPEVGTYYNEATMTQEDWENELALLISILEELGNSSLNLNDPLNTISGELLDLICMTKGIRGQLVTKINEVLGENLTFTDADIALVEAKDPANHAAQWNKELTAIRNIKDTLAAATITREQALGLYDDSEVVLPHTLMVRSSETIIKKLPTIGSYYQGSVVVADYANELDVLMNVLQETVDQSLDIENVFNDPINNMTGYGSVIVKFKDSEVLKSQFANSINAEINSKGISGSPVTVEMINQINDASVDGSAWDAEFSEISEVFTLVQSADYLGAYTKANNSTSKIAKSVASSIFAIIGL